MASCNEETESAQPMNSPIKAAGGTGYCTLEDIRAKVVAQKLRLAFFVTALPLELAAVRAHVTNLGAIRTVDGTIFECGTFADRGQKWLIVMGETRAGTHNAQLVVTAGHTVSQVLGKFELMIFVGIGGSRKKGAPIGSVVAADKVYYPYGGKYTGGMLANRPDSRPMDSELINIAQKVSRDELWATRILPSRGGPKPYTDDYPVELPPPSKVAPIASIEAVLDDPKSELEALLKASYGDTHVVEMEGYGAVFAAAAVRTPGMILRGVSDMTEKKSDEDDDIYQPIAAAHAAAFAFEMLSHWGMHNDAPGGGGSAILDISAAPLIPESEEATVTPAADEVSSSSKPLASEVKRSAVVPVSTTSTTPASTTIAISVVLNLSANFGPDDRERLDRLQETLRSFAGSHLLQIVEARAGSLLLFVADPEEALAKIGVNSLREALLERENVELVGMMPIAFYDARGEQLADLGTASADLLNWPISLPDGDRLERPELEELSRRMEENSASTTAVIGEPGSGKSALLAMLGNSFRAKGWPVLAIKADLIDADVSNEADLMEFLGLTNKPSSVLRDLAVFGPVLLIIDQLDALAGYLDVKTARLSVLLNLVRRLGRLENVHVVLSSRIFEFQHDVRLRAVNAESIMLELPPWDEVLAVLDARGVAAGGWPADAQQVMRTPQALSTYLLLNGRYSSEPFTSYQLMLDRLWDERVLAGSGGDRDRLASDIAEAMAEQESLWLAASRFSDRSAELQALVAAGILTTLDSSVGFSHQTLFEFTLARSFAREPGRLSAFVIERQGSLFLRPKLWAGLTYLRGADRDLYHQELEAVWRTEGLRAHLHVLLIDFLGSQPEPTDREALLMETALTGKFSSLRGFKALSGSSGWFNRFADSYIASAMRGEERLANVQIEVLSRAQGVAPEKVAYLIREHWLPDATNDLRTWAVIHWSVPWSEDILNIALTVVGRADLASGAVDNVAGSVAVEQPEIALRLVRARLDLELDVAIATAQSLKDNAPPPPGDDAEPDEVVTFRLGERIRNPVRNLIEKSNEWDSLSGIAEKWPQEMLDAIWPWFVRALDALNRLRGNGHRLGYPLSLEADFRFDGENDLDLPEGSILGALRIAVEGLADANPQAFRGWVSEAQTVELTPAQRLIAHGIAHRPEPLAEVGLDFVLGDERRYYLGSLSDMHGTIKRMVEAVSPHWTPEQVQRFEDQVLAYAPPPPPDEPDAKGRMRWRHSMRQTQLDLLRALPAHQRSSLAVRQVDEGERRYGSERRRASFTGVRMIGSIIEADGMSRASDDDIVNAFVELPDATGWDNPRHWMAGGNIQLARAFATFSKDNVDRAASILGRLDKDNGVRAAAYALDAMSEAASPSTVFQLLRDVVARGFDGEEFRHSVARALDRMAGKKIEIPDDLLALLEEWVANPPASEIGAEQAEETDAGAPAEVAEEAQSDEDAVVNRSLLWGYGGFDTFPGGDVPVADAIVHIWLLRQEPGKALEFLSGYLNQQTGVRAWEILARYLSHLRKTDRAKRSKFFDRLLNEVRGVVGSKPYAQFLATTQQDDHELVERHLDVWKDSPVRAARQAYGEIVGLDALLRPEHVASVRRLEDIVADAAQGAAQVGVALSAAHLYAEEPDRRVDAANLLARLLGLQNPDIWNAAFELFRLTDELVADKATTTLLRAIVDGLPRSPKLNPTFVVDRLATLLPHQAQLVGQFALGLVAKWKSELGDIRTSTAMATSALVDLAITLHRLGPETREIGLILFEQLIDIDAYEALQVLDEIDNRFRPAEPYMRPRVRRRSQVSPRRPRRRS